MCTLVVVGCELGVEVLLQGVETPIELLPKRHLVGAVLWNRSQMPLVCGLLTFVFVWSMSLTAQEELVRMFVVPATKLGSSIRILAATAVVGGNKTTALQIALAHFLYNLIGVVVVYGTPWLRRVPLHGAQWIAEIGPERKGLALAYILSVFFAIPAVLTVATLRLF